MKEGIEAALRELVEAVEAKARWSNKREQAVSPRMEQALAIAKEFLAECEQPSA